MREFWSAEDLEYLRSHAASTPLREMAETLGRSADAVRRACKRQGIRHKLTNIVAVRRVWTAQQRQWLIENAPTKTVQELSVQLGVPDSPIRAYLRRIGVKMRRVKQRWEGSETLKLLQYAESRNKEEIARKLGRPTATVSAKMAKLGVRAYAGRRTLSGMARETGYHYSQIEAARDALGQQWKRTRKQFLVTERQYQELMGYFRGKKAT